MRISDWSSDVCSSDLVPDSVERPVQQPEHLTKAHLLRCRNWWVSTFVGAGEPDRGKFHAQTWSHERRPVARRCKPVLLKKPTLWATVIHMALSRYLQDRKSTRLNSSH